MKYSKQQFQSSFPFTKHTPRYSQFPTFFEMKREESQLWKPYSMATWRSNKQLHQHISINEVFSKIFQNKTTVTQTQFGITTTRRDTLKKKPGRDLFNVSQTRQDESSPSWFVDIWHVPFFILFYFIFFLTTFNSSCHTPKRRRFTTAVSFYCQENEKKYSFLE
jgi:hypothetical protein